MLNGELMRFAMTALIPVVAAFATVAVAASAQQRPYTNDLNAKIG